MAAWCPTSFLGPTRHEELAEAVRHAAAEHDRTAADAYDALLPMIRCQRIRARSRFGAAARVRTVRLPMAFHEVLARVSEAVMTVPLVARAQVRMLREGIVEPVLAPDALPAGLLPRTPFGEATIRAAVPPRERFGRKDLRLVNDPAVRVP